MTELVRVIKSFVNIVGSEVSTLPNQLTKVADESVSVGEVAVGTGVRKYAYARDEVSIPEAIHGLGAEKVVVSNAYVAIPESKLTVGPMFRVVSENVAVVDSAQADTSLIAASPVRPNDQPSPLRVIVADIAPSQDEDAERATVYAFAANTSRDAPSRSILAYENIDGGQTFVHGSLPEPSIMGYVTDWDLRPRLRGQLDCASTIDVRVTSGEIESVTMGEMIGGANRVILNGVVFAFQTATQLTELHEYRLSGILWGLLGTSIQIDANGRGDQVWAMFDGPRLAIPIPWTALDQQHRISFVPAGYDENEDEDDYYDIQIEGRSILPMTVANVQGTQDVTGDWTITWDRVTRLPRQRLFGPRSFRDIDGENYRVEIVDAGSVVRTITATGSQTTYSSAQQTADFGSTQDALQLRVTRSNDSGDSQTVQTTVSVPYAVQEPYVE